ncbi:MAG: carboxypeptidase regulatory-like domain-containing protein [Acidobacteriota bacterium]
MDQDSRLVRLRRWLSLSTSVCLVILGSLLGHPVGWAQDPVAALEGEVRDPSGSVVSQANVTVTHLDTGYAKTQMTSLNGFYRLSLLPVGRYSVSIDKVGFSRFRQQPVWLNVSQTVRLDVQLELASKRESIVIEADAALVDTATNTLGKVVTTREILDLPLNGRNFAQLGLLQAGVAGLTRGVASAGGSLRSGQAYSVNGQRPESNNFLVDGARNINRMDGGFALRVPVDAIAEFRILTHTAPSEYGGTSGANTSVVTKSGTNGFHGSLYEFLRNDQFDTRNFFSKEVEPLKQNQFGGTLGGPLKPDRMFFFGYYEGFRNRQGITRSGIVPTPEQRRGDFSARSTPLLNLAAGGIPFPNNQLPPEQLNSVALNIMNLYYPLGNISPSVYTATVVASNNSDQGGGRFDYLFSESDQLWLRYSYSVGSNVNPISIRGSDLPGFPVRDDLKTHSLTMSEQHVFSPKTINSARLSYFRHRFHFDQRLNQTSPRELGFNYDPVARVGQGPPFFNISGYSPVGGAITGPRVSAQSSLELYDSVSHVRGAHSLKFGGELRRNHVNTVQIIAPNAFFVFAPSFPTNDSFANFLLGRPVVFFQGLGDVGRGLREWQSALYVQDEWRVNTRLTVNYGLRHEVNTPVTDVRDRLNAFVPGQQSTVFPEAQTAILFPGDAGIARGIAPIFWKGYMPRVGLAWDPRGNGRLAIRVAYGIFFDAMSTGSGLLSQAPVSSLPWTQALQLAGPAVTFQDPYAVRPPPQPNTFVRPATVVALDKNARPPYAQNWNLSIQREIRSNYLLEARYVGSKGTRLPRNIEANPAIFGPGATASNAERRRIYGNCPANGAPCAIGHVALLSYITNSTFHAGQLSFSRRFTSGAGFNVSYWLSKTLDYLSAMNLSGAAARPLTGENDMAQNPFDLGAEHGPSLFDARHRLVFSGSYEIPVSRRLSGWRKTLLGNWQLNGIANITSGTPFTVFDSANVSLQANHPPISGFFASRPDAVANPNEGPRTIEQWLSRSAFRRLDPIREAGRFGNAGRNIARGPGYANLDLSLLKSFRMSESRKLEFRVECFNMANHANFSLPVTDLASPSFGRIIEAGPARLLQFGLKFLF